VTAWQTVHVRVNDAATGQPTPCRVRFTGADGTYYAPLGRLSDFATGRNQDVGGNVLLGTKQFAYIDGVCEIPLPAGRIAVEIVKGFEYQPVRQETNLAPGQLALRFTLDRAFDPQADGWFAGDTRVHYLPPHAALLEGAAENLAVVNLLVNECTVIDSYGKLHPALPNITAVSGQHPAVQSLGHLVIVNTHNSHPVLGSLGLLNCHRTVFPLHFGGSDGKDDWTLADWCDQCHRKGGLVVWTRVWHESEDFPLGEPLADLILGKVDALEIDFFEDSPFDVLPDWYALLNCGFKVPIVGGSGKDSNGMLLGAMRTYTRVPPVEGFSYKTWIESVRSGRTFATNSPLLFLQVNGQQPGAVIELSARDATVCVKAEACSIVPFDVLEIVAGDSALATVQAAGDPASARLELDLPVPECGWLAARCRGERQLHHRPANQRIFAHTSPVYVRIPGQLPRTNPAAVKRFARYLEQMLTWAEHEARCDTDRQRAHLMEVFQAAMGELEARGSKGQE
jgi:hypothetical protein